MANVLLLSTSLSIHPYASGKTDEVSSFNISGASQQCSAKLKMLSLKQFRAWDFKQSKSKHKMSLCSSSWVIQTSGSAKILNWFENVWLTPTLKLITASDVVHANAFSSVATVKNFGGSERPNQMHQTEKPQHKFKTDNMKAKTRWHLKIKCWKKKWHFVHSWTLKMFSLSVFNLAVLWSKDLQVRWTGNSNLSINLFYLCINLLDFIHCSENQ